MAYWLPPLTKAFFDGDSKRVESVLTVLKAGDFPVAKRSFEGAQEVKVILNFTLRPNLYLNIAHRQ